MAIGCETAWNAKNHALTHPMSPVASKMAEEMIGVMKDIRAEHTMLEAKSAPATWCLDSRACEHVLARKC